MQRPSQIEIRLNHVHNSNIGDHSDDKVYRFFYRQRVVAIVSESRDDANYIVFDFFDNSGGFKPRNK